MSVKVKNGMFYVYDRGGAEVACFKSLLRMAEFLRITEAVNA